MAKVTCGVTMSIDGFMAGLNMTEKKPFGDMDIDLLMGWMFKETQINKKERAYVSSEPGAYIMGRNMFGPRGAKYDKQWRGWWGEEPVYHAPVFVLTHKPREPLVMKGGTTFTFVNNGIELALNQARKAAGNKNILIAGGANTVNQYLAAGLIDELWLHIVPLTIGRGKRLFEKVPNLKMEPLDTRTTKLVTHVKYKVLH